MRKYEAIWLTIKAKGSCKVRPASTNLALFNRIRKAVVKEKYTDLAFKVEYEERRFKLIVNRSVDGKVITFSLQKSISLEDL